MRYLQPIGERSWRRLQGIRRAVDPRRPALFVVNGAIWGMTRALCRIDAADLQRVPAQGPLILVSNHINFLEIPLVYTHLQPRPITGFVKSETWDDPFLRHLFNLWEGIPIRRGEPDLAALRKGLEALRQEKIVAISPEGTRSGHGRLQRGHPGVVTFALMSGAPLLPMVYFGGEALYRNLRRLRRTDFTIRVGKPFKLHTGGRKLTRELRQQIADEIMYQLAALLPAEYRGVYADLERATGEFFDFGDSAG